MVFGLWVSPGPEPFVFDKRADDRYKKEERYKRDEEDDERAVDRSKDKSKEKFKERSKDRRMKTSSNKKSSRRNDRKVLMAEESTKSWADSNSESSSSSSFSSDSEQEEVHCFMADHASDDETLSHTFEEIKAENASLKNNSAESSSDELEDTDSLKTGLSKMRIENELLRSESSELKAEVDKLTKEMSSWTQSARAFQKLQEIQKSALDGTGLGFSNSESSGETSTQSQPVYDKFNKMGFVKAYVIHDCLESIRYDDQDTSQLDRKGKGKVGVGYQRPENSKPGWLKNKLNKDKAKAGPKFFVPNQPRHYSKKAKTEWTRNQPKESTWSKYQIKIQKTSTQFCTDLCGS
ncbi:hypothetical protein F511_19637 [Dorcoceras hygrometricum]|uniref:Uncharacterized protein n=1 Tax=Dorcoceras hygrometricum TaxID=472368 RepID=A0A2Z7C838_9LAMI|nr:hypothetical protein F511_19637 [Dorcoceras hygrometricum]